MIDSEYTVKPKTLSKFTPIPADKYQVQITDVNLVQMLNQFSGKEEDRLNFEFTVLDNKTHEVVNEGVKEIESIKGRRLWKRIAPSISPAGKKSKASWLYKLLCAVEKKELQEDDLKEFSPVSLIGQQVMVMVEVAGEWNNILGFQKADKDLEPVPNAPERAQEEQTVGEDIDDKELDELFKGEEKK